MVINEKTKKTFGSQVGLNMSFSSEPDFICSDKTAQTIFEAADDLTQYKKTNSYTAHISMPDQEKRYVLKTKTKVRERAYTVQPKPEFENFLPKEKQTKEEAGKHLEYHLGITFQPFEDVLDEKPQKNDATATVTGQILLAVASLRDADKNSIQAAAAMLNSILKKERNKLRGKVPEIIDIIYFHMRAIQEPSAREAAIGAVCLLAEKHTEETITSLLRLSVLCDRHIAQIWEGLGQAKQPVRLQILAKLIEVLKRRPSFRGELPESDPTSKDNSPLLPLAATKALCIIFRDKKCKVPMNSFYVSVIIFLVIQLHYLMDCSDTDDGQEELLQTSSYISCTMEALKALVKRETTSRACFASLTGSWDLLSSPENYLEGVLLLARALVKHHRGLDYAIFTKVIPLLHHGDDKQKLTAMAFFTALLSSESTYTVLQKHYILGLLKNWLSDSSATYRWLSLHGMGNVAHHLQSKKELTALILGIIPSFDDTDEKVALTAMEVIMKVMVKQKINVNQYVKITKQLQPFLADGRNKVSCAANGLFQEILKNIDAKDKYAMQDQVLTAIVTLMVNLQELNLDAAKSRMDSLQECKVFLGWTTDDNEDSWDMICKNLVKEHPGKLRRFLNQAQDYRLSPQKSSRSAATIFIDSILHHMESSPMQKTEVDFLKQGKCMVISLDILQLFLETNQWATELLLQFYKAMVEITRFIKSEAMTVISEAFSNFPSEKQCPVVLEPEKVCRFCPDLFRCSRYFPRSCI